jgi:hypothetical protein
VPLAQLRSQGRHDRDGQVRDAYQGQVETRIRKLVENVPDLTALVEPLLIVRRVVREQLAILHRRLLAIVRDDDVCWRLMTVPGVGPVVALTYRVTVDVPVRFRNSKAVGAVFGLEAQTGRAIFPHPAFTQTPTNHSVDDTRRLQRRLQVARPLFEALLGLLNFDKQDHAGKTTHR